LACTPGSKDPACRYQNNKIKIVKQCVAGSVDPECLPPVPVCFPGSNDPRCQSSRIPDSECEEGTNNPNCQNTRVPKQRCYPGSTDEQCRTAPVVPPREVPVFPPEVYQPPTTPVPNVVPEFNCKNNPNDYRCRNVITEKPFINPYQPPTTQTIPKICFPNSNDPECAGVRVVKIQPHTIQVPDTPLQVLCRPGSTNPLCNKSSQRLKCILNPEDISCVTEVTDSPCPIGSTDPKCTQFNRESTFQTKPTERPTIPDITTAAIRTYKQNRCEPGSTDPRCIQIIQVPLVCLLDSQNPKCRGTPPTIPTIPYLKEEEVNQMIAKIPQSKETKIPVCGPGSNNRECTQEIVSVVDCNTNPNNPKCIIPVIPVVTTPRAEPNQPTVSPKPFPVITDTPAICKFYPNDPSCFQGYVQKEIVTRRPKINCNEDPQNPECPRVPETPPFNPCGPGSNDVNCRPKVPQIEEECTPFSRDPKCYEKPRPAPPAESIPIECIFNVQTEKCLSLKKENPPPAPRPVVPSVPRVPNVPRTTTTQTITVPQRTRTKNHRKNERTYETHSSCLPSYGAWITSKENSSQTCRNHSLRLHYNTQERYSSNNPTTHHGIHYNTSQNYKTTS